MIKNKTLDKVTLPKSICQVFCVKREWFFIRRFRCFIGEGADVKGLLKIYSRNMQKGFGWTWWTQWTTWTTLLFLNPSCPPGASGLHNADFANKAQQYKNSQLISKLAGIFNGTPILLRRRLWRIKRDLIRLHCITPWQAALSAMCGSAVNPAGGKNTFGVFCGFEKISKPQVHLGVT